MPVRFTNTVSNVLADFGHVCCPRIQDRPAYRDVAQ